MFSVLYFQELYLYDSAGKELFSEIVQKYVSLSHKVELYSVLKMHFICWYFWSLIFCFAVVKSLDGNGSVWRDQWIFI